MPLPAALTGPECCGLGEMAPPAGPLGVRRRLYLLLAPGGGAMSPTGALGAWEGDCASCRAPGGGGRISCLVGAPSALLCCTGRVLSAWFGVLVLVPFFFPVTIVQEFPCPHGPISTSSRLPWSFPSPVNVYIVSLLVSACLHRHAQCAPRPGLPHVDPLGEALPPLCSLSLADLVTLYRTVCIMVLGLGGSDPLGPSCSLQLV